MHPCVKHIHIQVGVNVLYSYFVDSESSDVVHVQILVHETNLNRFVVLSCHMIWFAKLLGD